MADITTATTLSPVPALNPTGQKDIGQEPKPPGADSPEKEQPSKQAEKQTEHVVQKEPTRTARSAKLEKSEPNEIGRATKTAATTEKLKPQKQEKAPTPQDIYRLRKNEKIAYLSHSELRPPKNHPFSVRDDAEMKALIESVKAIGVSQPALVRPLESGGYEIVCGNRRRHANELAGYKKLPCIVRSMSDDEAALAMTDDNLRQRSVILPSERAQSLKIQVEAIKHQGTQLEGAAPGDIGKRSVEIIGERNGIIGKQVQRYIRLTELVPDLLRAVDEKKLGFASAVEISFIKPKNQSLIAVSIEGQEANPSLSQAQRMRELDSKNLLNGDVIDGILCEERKEELKVVISEKELETYFGKGKTPREMKDQIMKLLDDWADREKAIEPPVKKTEREI